MFFNDKELQVRDFPVNKDYGDEEQFFRLITEGGEVQLPKLQFQKDQPLPDTLSCRVKGYNGNVPVLGHNMPRYVSEFYADGFSKQQEFEFQVISVSDAAKGYYRLIDGNGLTFNLHETKTILSRGQTIKCKFDVVEQNFFKLHRSTTDKQFPMVNLSKLASKIVIKGINAAKLEVMLQQIPELSTALDEMNHGRPIWILTAMRALRGALPRIFRKAIDEEMPYDMMLDAIRGYERVLLYLLQGSGFLRNIKGNERVQLQAEITANIEQLDTYKRTIYLIKNGEERKFINDLLNNLKESGYIYHPTTQFSTMMILFRLSPELVNSSLGNIFDTLMGWDPETWKTEPFRQAFVEQLEIYISETREEIDSFLQAETAADNEKIERVLTAIAIQQALATANDSVDIRLNKSLFYRYLSVLRKAKASVLLEKSYLALMGVHLPTDYKWSDIKEPTMMMTRAAVDPPRTATLPSNPLYFFTDSIDVEFGPKGIKIVKPDEHTDNDDSCNVLPNGMLGWPGLKVNVTLSKAINRTMLKTMDGHEKIWNNIENALFVPDTDAVEQTQQTQRVPYIDDTVRVEVIRVITNAVDSNRIEGFECVLRDEHFVACRAIMPAENVVNYNLHGVTVGTFRRDDGSPMLFDAQVVDIDENDTLILSLQDSTKRAIRDMANVGEECYCVVTKDNGRSYSAISEKGFGLFINKEDPTLPPFRKSNVVKVSITGFNYDAIQSVAIDGPIDNFPFSNARALHNLLDNIAVDDYESSIEELQYDEGDMISADNIREIIEIFRFKAISETDILSSYDYLSYARLLALIINDEKLAHNLKTHKEILMLHQHYAKNKQIFIEDIDRLLENPNVTTYISRMASRLQIVASLGEIEHNPFLWDTVNHSPIEAEVELAQMVLSYNLLYEMDHDDPTASSIKEMIAKKLNVSSELRALKYYGSESQYVEFKSSLVYPAQKGKSGLSVADPDKQEFEILHIIAGFLNSTGGTLYIGVNDDHYERGLEEDFTFYRMDNTERNTKFRRNIKTLDNMANHLQNLIDSAFCIGRNAGDYAKVYIDEESTKGVIGVKIDPCPHIVYLDDNLYVRHSAKTEPLLRKEELDRFIADRPQLYRQLVSAAATPMEDEQVEPSPTPAAEKKAEETPVASAVQIEEVIQQPADNFTVKTSKVRKNILHEYADPDHFVTPRAYIRFVGDSDYIITTDEWSIDTESDRLVLTVKDEEADGYLLLVYEGDYAIKVKLSELLEKNENMAMPHYAGKKLEFAAPVKPDSGLYCMYTNSKNTLYERVTPIDKIAQGSMGTTPERILECGTVETALREIVSPEKMGDFADILSSTMKRTQIGALVKGMTAIKTSVESASAAIISKLS